MIEIMSDGESQFPTFSLNNFINPDSLVSHFLNSSKFSRRPRTALLFVFLQIRVFEKFFYITSEVAWKERREGQ